MDVQDKMMNSRYCTFVDDVPVTECNPFVTLAEAGLFVLAIGRFNDVHVAVFGAVQDVLDLLLYVSSDLGWVFVARSRERLQVDIGDKVNVSFVDTTSFVTHGDWI
jgi:hypothetical protein